MKRMAKKDPLEFHSAVHRSVCLLCAGRRLSAGCWPDLTSVVVCFAATVRTRPPTSCCSIAGPRAGWLRWPAVVWAPAKSRRSLRVSISLCFLLLFFSAVSSRARLCSGLRRSRHSQRRCAQHVHLDESGRVGTRSGQSRRIACCHVVWHRQLICVCSLASGLHDRGCCASQVRAAPEDEQLL